MSLSYKDSSENSSELLITIDESALEQLRPDFIPLNDTPVVDRPDCHLAVVIIPTVLLDTFVEFVEQQITFVNTVL